MTCIYCTDLRPGLICDECGQTSIQPLKRRFRLKGGFKWDQLSHIEYSDGCVFLVKTDGTKGDNRFGKGDIHSLESALDCVRAGEWEEI
jgi:hypothetical protein